jgi:hypothetical protein
MTEIEISLCGPESQNSFFEQTISAVIEENSNNGLALASREERAALLKAGFTGQDIESQYLRLNGIIVIGVAWKDLKS